MKPIGCVEMSWWVEIHQAEELTVVQEASSL